MNKHTKFFVNIAFALCAGGVMHGAIAETHTVKLCEANQYISKCGDVTIGTNFLKGYDDASPRWNYYDYAEQNNVINLRKIFAGTEAITFRGGTGASDVQTLYPATYIPNRNDFLRRICNPLSSSTRPKCTACPNGGKTAKSTVEVELVNGQYDISDNTWSFHTFADCYKDKFEDATGSFKYIDNNSNDQSCYYKVEIKGDALASDSWTDVLLEDFDGLIKLEDNSVALQ